MSEGGSYLNSRLVSSSQKREIMWNIIEPGDPYDIRKSMIAQLPGRKNFMGTHLELVCLLQAAEIERLCEYLEEYKLKLREVERRELDRHSYEIQIKELSQRLSQEGTFRGENAKLKDFIRKQTLELEELRKSSVGWESELGRKYEQSLRQVEVLLQENEGLRGSTAKLRTEWQQAMSAKTLETEELQRRLREVSVRSDSQKTQAFFKLQIDFKKLQFQNKRLREMLQGKNREIQELQSKSKQLLYQVQELGSQLKQYATVGHTLTQYENRFSLLGQQLDRLNLVLRQKSGELSETSNRLRVAQQQSRRRQDRIQDLQRRKSQLQESKRELQSKMLENMRNLSGLDQSRNLVRSYQLNLQKLSGEIERLNGVLRRKVQELEQANRKLSEFEYESRRNESARKQAEEFRVKFADFSRKIVQYQNRVALLSQQVERLSQTLKRKGDQIFALQGQLRNRTGELEALQKSKQELQIDFRSEMSRLHSVNQSYEATINELRRESQLNRFKKDQHNTGQPSSPPRGESALERQYQIQIQRLSVLLQNKNAELQARTSQLHVRTSELQAYERERGAISDRDSFDRQRLVQHYQSELGLRNRELQGLKATLGEYEKRILSSAQEIKRLSGLLNKSPISSPERSPEKSEDSLLQRKVTEYQNKLAIMNQEIDRLNENLRAKGAENKNLQGRLRALQEEARRQQNVTGESDRKVSLITQENGSLREQIRVAREQLRQLSVSNQSEADKEIKVRQLLQQNGQLSHKLSEFQFQMTTLSHEIQRLNNVLKLKVQQSSGWQQKVRSTVKELQQAKRRNQEYQNKITVLNREYDVSKETVNKNVQFENDSLKRRIAELQNYNREYEGRVREFQLKIRQYENKSKQYQRRVLESERRTQECEQQMQIIYQQRDQAGGALNENKRRFAQYENKIVVLSQEIERLNEVLQKVTRQNGELKRRVGEIQTLKSTIVTLQQRFSRAAQQNEQLRHGVNESTTTTRRQNQQYQFKLRSLAQENEQLTRSIKQTQQKLLAISREMDRLSSVLKSKGEEGVNLQNRLRSAREENEGLSRRVQELTATTRRIGEYDGKISMLSGEIQRLNGILKTKVDEVGALQGRCRVYEQQVGGYKRRLQEYETSINRQMQGKIIFLTKENEQLRGRVKQLSGEANKIPEWQSKFGLVYAQVQRLNSNLKMKVDEVGMLEGKARQFEQDIEKYRRRCEELQNTLHRELKSQSSVFEQRVGQLTQENEALRRNVRELTDGNRRLSESQGRALALGKQVERLSEVASRYSHEVVPGLQQKIRASGVQNQKLRQKLGDLSEVSHNYQELLVRYKGSVQEIEQYNRRVQEYETRMSQISSQIERLNNIVRGKVEQLNSSEAKLRQSNNQVEILTKKLRESSEVSRRIPEYESKISFLSQQIQRLNGLMRVKVQQSHNLQSQLRKYSHEYQIVQRRCSELQNGLAEQKSGRAMLQQRLAGMGQENEQMRKAVRELSDSNRRIVDYESRLALLSQEIERLNNSLRTKVQELNSAENSLRNYRRDAQSRTNSLQGELQEQKRRAVESSGAQATRIAQYESKLLLMSQEIERLNYVLKEHGFEIEVVQKKEVQYLAQIERLNNTLRLKVEESSRWEQANNQLRLRLKASQQGQLVVSQEFQKLKLAHGTLTQEYTRANKHLVQYQQSINKLYQEFERLQSMLQELKRQNYELKTKLQESGNLAEMNRVLSAEIDRLNKIVTTQNKDLEQLRLYVVDQSALQRRINEYMALLVVLFAEIESLRLRVKETQMEIQTVRRSSLAPFKI